MRFMLLVTSKRNDYGTKPQRSSLLQCYRFCRYKGLEKGLAGRASKSKSKSIAFKSKSKSESLEPKSKSKSSKNGLKSGLEYYKSDIYYHKITVYFVRPLFVCATEMEKTVFLIGASKNGLQLKPIQCQISAIAKFRILMSNVRNNANNV